MTTVNFISQVRQRLISITCNEANRFKVGGLMGLCLGFSFLSVIEVVYWFTYRMGRNVL